MDPNAILYLGGIATIAVAIVLITYPLAGLEAAISNAMVDENFAQTALIPNNHSRHPFPIDAITLNPDDTLTVTFKGGHDAHTDREIHFNHAETYAAGESFVWGCHEAEEGVYLDIFIYLGGVTFNRDQYIVIGEYAALAQEPMPCAYPDVIVHSRNAVDLHGERGQETASVLHAHFERMFAESDYTMTCGDGERSITWGGQELVEKILNFGELCEVS